MTTRKRHPGGRPRKFSEPSHPVTVTLPERTLKNLYAIDKDRARAIARVTDMAIPDEVPPAKLVEVARVAPGIGMLVVPPSRLLRSIRLIRLVEVAPSRFLITVPTGTAPSELEVALHDALEDTPMNELRERGIVTELLKQMRHIRKSDGMSKAEVLFVAL